MTLILTLANSRHAIQLSDRRLTSLNGAVDDDRSNKATVLVCANGRFAVGYTGLAHYRNFRTQQWLLDTLCECSPPDFGIAELIGRFIKKAEHDFANQDDLRELNSNQKRLSVMFSGFLYQPKALVANLILSNYQDWTLGTDKTEASPDFRCFWEVQREDASSTSSLIQRVGAWALIPSDDLQKVRTMLSEQKAQHAIVAKGCALIREAADRPSGKTVGKDIMSVVIPSERDVEVSAVFQPYKAADVTFLPDLVIPTSSSCLVVKDFTFGPITPIPGEPFLRPRLRKNQLCWCGSKKQFKKCHGQNGGRRPRNFLKD